MFKATTSAAEVYKFSKSVGDAVPIPTLPALK